MPKRADEILAHRLANDSGAVLDFVSKCPLPEFQQMEPERDQPSRGPAFDLQVFFFREALREVSSAQR